MTSSVPFLPSLRPSHSLPVDAVHDAPLTAPSKKSRSHTVSEDGIPRVFTSAISPSMSNIVSASISKRPTAQQQLHGLRTNMTGISSPLGSPKIGAPPPTKLHKRCSSATSLPSPGSQTPVGLTLQSPSATFEEISPTRSSSSLVSPSSISAKAKALSYRHRRASSREDQGQIDLSKSTAENAQLSGLGIQDFEVKSASDVDFSRSMRRGSHVRAQSATYPSLPPLTGPRASQPFVHPMRQTPRPYTPRLAGSYASSLNDEEINESVDVIEETLSASTAFRNKRSMSMSSAHQGVPTPLSQSHTPDEIEPADISSRLASVSHGNLSMRSEQSIRPTRPRRDTDMSTDYSTAPSSRNSLDRARSFVSGKPREDSLTRDDRVRAARRKFDEKEAEKDRKLERSAARRRDSELAKYHRQQERQRRQSESSDRTGRNSFAIGRSSTTSETNTATKLPIASYGKLESKSEKTVLVQDHSEADDTANEKTAKATIVRKKQRNWARLQGWVHTHITCAK